MQLSPVFLFLKKILYFLPISFQTEYAKRSACVLVSVCDLLVVQAPVRSTGGCIVGVLFF